MGRPSKLSDKQWDELGKRLYAGEKAAELAREYGVSKTAISVRFSKRAETVKGVANQILAAEHALRALPISEQIAAVSLADDLRAISSHMAGAGKYGAATAHRLSGIAHGKVQEIDDAKPLDDDSRETLRDIAVLTRLANDAAVIPSALLSANKEITKELNQAHRPRPASIPVVVVDAGILDADS